MCGSLNVCRVYSVLDIMYIWVYTAGSIIYMIYVWILNLQNIFPCEVSQTLCSDLEMHNFKRCFGARIYTYMTWFDPTKPGLQSMARCGTVCVFSIANSTFTNSPIVGLLVLFYIIYWCFLTMLLHYYNPFINGSPYYNVSYYN